MINCVYNRDTHTITIDGHANYAEYGVDIVCAGITALEISLQKYLEKQALLGKAVSITVDGCKSSMHAEECDEAFETIWSGITEIAQHYSDYVSAWVG